MPEQGDELLPQFCRLLRIEQGCLGGFELLFRLQLNGQQLGERFHHRQDRHF